MISGLHSGTMTQAGSNWEIMILRPGGSPIENIARALVEADLYDGEDPNAIPRLMATLSRSRFGLVEAIKQSDDVEPGANLLLVVDQFEELFRFRQQDVNAQETAAAFVNLLLTASMQEECPIYVTITMRSDYLGDCSEIPGLAEAVNQGEYLIPRLPRDQKREAIEMPIGVGGAKIDPLLVQRLLNEVGDDQDQLPVLQHALMRMWDVWSAGGNQDRSIDFSDYEATGELTAALSNHADEVYHALPGDAHRTACEKIFKTLTEKGNDNRGIRRPTRLTQLKAISGADQDTVIEVLDAYRQAGVTFLMPGMDVALEDQTVLDLSHESLMRGWQRLRSWVDKEAQSARVFRRLLDTARLWADGRAGLFRNPDLQIALSWREEEAPNAEWSEQYGGHFDRAVAFLEESDKEDKAEEQAREAARKRELEQTRKLAEAEHQRAELQKRAAGRLRGMVAGFAVIAAIAVITSVMAYFAKQAANDAKLIAEQSEISARENADLAESEAERAKKEAERADLQKTIAVEAKEVLRDKLYSSDIMLAGHSYTEGNMDLMTELLLAQVPGDENAEDLRNFEWYYWWGAAHGESRIIKDLGTPFRGLAASPDGKHIAVIMSSNLRIYDMDTEKLINDVNLTGFINRKGITFSRDGTLVALRGPSLFAFLNLKTGQINGSGYAESPTRSFAFSPTEDIVVTGDESGAIQFWDTGLQQKGIVQISESGFSIQSLAYAPDGNLLLIGTGETLSADEETTENALLGDNAPLLLWDVKTGAIAAQVPGHQSSNNAVAWAPDGNLIASGGHDSTIRIWRNDFREVTTLYVKAPVTALAFSGDGQYLCATTETESALQVWYTDSWKRAATLKGHSGSVEGFAFTPVPGELWSVGEDGTLREWNLTRESGGMAGSVENPLLRKVLSEANIMAQILPDGKTLISAIGGDTLLRYYDLEKHEVLPPRDAGGPIRTGRKSLNGTMTALISTQGHLRVWDTQARQMIWEANVTDDLEWLSALAVSDDGGAAAWVFDEDANSTKPGYLVVQDQKRNRQFRLNLSGEPRSLEFSPNGEKLLVDTIISMVVVDVETQQISTIIESVEGWQQVWQWPRLKAFSRDGNTCAVSFGRNEIYIHSTHSQDEVPVRLKGHAGAVRSADFSLDGRRLVSGADDGLVKVWDVSTGDVLMTFTGHTGPIDSVNFNKDGSAITSMSRYDGTIRYWRAPSANDLEQDPAYWQELAQYHSESGNVGMALAAYTKAIDLKPDEAEYYLARAALSESTGQLETTLQDAIEVISLGKADQGFTERARSMAILKPLESGSTGRTLWQYSFDKPADTWMMPDFDDATWSAGLAPFGSYTSDATFWSLDAIWMRRPFFIEKLPDNPVTFWVQIDDQAEIYLNGVLAGRRDFSGYQYTELTCSKEAVAALKPGKNILAVHALNEGGRAAISVWPMEKMGPQPWQSLLANAIDKKPENTYLHAERFRWSQFQGDTQLARANATELIPLLQNIVDQKMMNSSAEASDQVEALSEALQCVHGAENSKGWNTLIPLEMVSDGGAALTTFEDGSILVSGALPETDTYTIKAQMDARKLVALRVEALPDPSLTRGGPGRSTRGNFHLTELSLSVAPLNSPEQTRSIPFKAAGGYTRAGDEKSSPGGAIDGTHDTRWDIGQRQGERTVSWYTTNLPVMEETPVILTIRMDFRDPEWISHSLGRFRLSVTDEPATLDREEATFSVEESSNSWVRLAYTYSAIGDQAAFERLLVHQPAAAIGVGDVYAAGEEWQKAIDLYTRIITADTVDSLLLAKRGDAYAGLNQWDKAEADWKRAAALDPNIADTFENYKALGNWKAAAVYGWQLLNNAPGANLQWIDLAPVLVLAGDEAGYRAFCEKRLLPASTTEFRAGDTCKICLLTPGGIALDRLPTEEFEAGLEQDVALEWLHEWDWAARALIAYRRGNPEEAIQYIHKQREDIRTVDARMLGLAVLALAQQDAEKLDDAEQTLTELDGIMNDYSEKTYRDWLIADILRKEAVALMKSSAIGP
jgi:WD40 repeat protein